jgi:diacylglycerol kinase (ATP)
MPKRTCIIANPNAGSAGELEHLREALGKLPNASLHVTEKEGDAREMAAQAVRSGADLVVAAGGDGTLNEVVNGLMESREGDPERVHLGLLPLGTGNDFARSINVPTDLDAAVAILETGRVQAVDVACATFAHQSRYFINVSAGGFSGVVSEKASEAKDRWGPLAYLRAAVGTLPELQGFKCRITVNGTEELELDTYNIVIANGRFVAAGIPVAPGAKLDDGLLDIMIAPAATLPQLALLIPQILLGRHTESDLLLFRKATRIKVESDPPMSFNVDGELIGDEPASFVVLPRALRIIVGPEEPAGSG